MDENNNSSFFDKNTILAILFSLMFFFGWQTYMQRKYPEAYNKTETASVDESSDTKDNLIEEESTESTSPTPQTEHTEFTQNSTNVVVENFEIENDLWGGELTSLGMGFTHFKLKKYSDRENQNIQFVKGEKNSGNFATYYKGKPLSFRVEKTGENQFVGTAQVAQQTITKILTIDPKNYTIAVSIKTLSGKSETNDNLETKLSNKVLKIKSSMFTPSYEGSEYFTINDGSEERERINIEETFNETFDKTTLTSIGSHYFAIALNDNSSIIPKTQLNFFPEEQVAYASVFHQPNLSNSKFDIQFTGFVGPKKYDILKTLDGDFVNMINYGMFSVLSKPMLKMLKWLYGMFQNWGLAIIFLTIFVRLLLLPINISSLKSMKKMQKIQPQLKAIKEKYKGDPNRMNQETMALMKKEGANPIGGCLPMLLQLPVFFALYSVLGQSVELYKAPFVFWIKDLSYQDPWFVLPIAVGLLYFVQMSITPQPTDPAQAKVMKFIPILFCFFMITVPSGLTLYFFVNTVFGIGQSFVFQREKEKAAA